MKTKILYISLTGMTEPLGRSQVLEYLIDLSKGNKIYLLSFERQNDLEYINEIKHLTENCAIEWHYFIYSNKYRVISTVAQIFKAIFFCSGWVKKNKIQIIHARSMIPATMALILKKAYGMKLLFDIRGFAIDEKADSHRLSKASLLFKVLKKLDDYLYRASDHIVTLTHAAKEILHNNIGIPNEKITVIPTCANSAVFKAMSKSDTQVFKSSLGYAQEDEIILHTGTVSGWYDFDSELLLIKEMIRQNKNVNFLVLNKNEKPFIHEMLEKYDLSTDRVKVMSSSFDEVYQYLNIADLSLFFIKPSFSKQASAPTKFAENVACNLPSITNGGVGDMEYYLQRYDVGYAVDLSLLHTQLEVTAQSILAKITDDHFTQADFNSLFHEHFDKKMAVELYEDIYIRLLEE